MTVELDRIIDFIRREVMCSKGKALATETDLRGDLRMLVEDADVLLGKFAQEFSVAPGDFELGRYFPAEGLWPLPWPSPFSAKRKYAGPPVRLTLGMLLQAAKDGVWNSSALERLGLETTETAIVSDTNSSQ
jgi:hypothetical protein